MRAPHAGSRAAGRASRCCVHFCGRHAAVRRCRRLLPPQEAAAPSPSSRSCCAKETFKPKKWMYLAHRTMSTAAGATSCCLLPFEGEHKYVRKEGKKRKTKTFALPGSNNSTASHVALSRSEPRMLLRLIGWVGENAEKHELVRSWPRAPATKPRRAAHLPRGAPSRGGREAARSPARTSEALLRVNDDEVLDQVLRLGADGLPQRVVLRITAGRARGGR